MHRSMRSNRSIRLFPSLVLLFFGFALRCHASDLENQLAQLFVNRSFTIRNFYKGEKLVYNSEGVLVSKAEPGYWSRDGMVLISSVKIESRGQLLMRGERYSAQFDPKTGELEDVRTGDHVEVLINFEANQQTFDATVPVLQKVFVTSHEKLTDVAPSYWKNCLTQKINREKNGLWECATADQNTPEFSGKKLEWDVPPPDTTLHTGMKLYLLEHRVAYVHEEGDWSSRRLQVSPDPIFSWEQRRVRLAQLTCVLSILIGEDGRITDISIVTPVGMGLDDDAVTALRNWRFVPAKRDGKPVRTPCTSLLSCLVGEHSA
jgi:TonB family protein